MIMREMLPLDYAMITKDGIRFKGSLFTSSFAVKEQWFLISDNSEGRSIPVCFDPENPDLLLLLIDGVGLIKAVKIQEREEVENKILEFYYSIFEDLKKKWRRRKTKSRGKLK